MPQIVIVDISTPLGWRVRNHRALILWTSLLTPTQSSQQWLGIEACWPSWEKDTESHRAPAWKSSWTFWGRRRWRSWLRRRRGSTTPPRPPPSTFSFPYPSLVSSSLVRTWQELCSLEAELTATYPFSCGWSDSDDEPRVEKFGSFVPTPFKKASWSTKGACCITEIDGGISRNNLGRRRLWCSSLRCSWTILRSSCAFLWGIRVRQIGKKRKLLLTKNLMFYLSSKRKERTCQSWCQASQNQEQNRWFSLKSALTPWLTPLSRNCSNRFFLQFWWLLLSAIEHFVPGMSRWYFFAQQKTQCYNFANSIYVVKWRYTSKTVMVNQFYTYFWPS